MAPGAYAASSTFTLTNTGSTTASYTLSVVINGSQRGALVTVSPASISVGAGATSTAQVSLSVPASAFAALPSDDTFVVGPGGVITVRGAIVASTAAGDPADHQSLRVPYMLVTRGLSNVAAGTPSGLTMSTPVSGATTVMHFNIY